jgi:uroporphyrinogen-III decarboxylase
MSKFDEYKPPASPVPELSESEWAEEIRKVNDAKARGELIRGDTEHGFLFLRHTYLRGFENAMEDYLLYPENVDEIYGMIVGYNMKLVNHHIRRGTDLMYFAEDLGTQTSTILSPEMFRRYVKPAYAELMQPCKRAGMMVGLHSDGKTLDILEDQIEAGVDIVNPQDLCNGIDELRKRIKGKACIQLDVDRQTVIPHGTSKDIDDLIREEITKLGAPEGGLMLVCGIYPPTPPENIDALAAAIEKYRGMWL